MSYKLEGIWVIGRVFEYFREKKIVCNRIEL